MPIFRALPGRALVQRTGPTTVEMAFTIAATEEPSSRAKGAAGAGYHQRSHRQCDTPRVRPTSHRSTEASSPRAGDRALATGRSTIARGGRVRGEPLVSAGPASGVLSGRSSRPLRSEQRVKALAAEEGIGGTAPLSADRRQGSGVARSPDVTCADLGPASAVLESRVDSWVGLGCDVVVEVEDVGGVVAALDLP